MVIDGVEYLDNVNWQFVRERQGEQLKTAKVIAKICEENGLRYFLDGGTLLGAFRHGGFIPWDDDIDFAMPRPDYDKLISIVKKTDGLKVLNWREDEDFSIPFSKIMRLGPGQKVSHHPSAIDVFPMDAAPRSKLIAKLQMKMFITTLNVLIYRKNRSACQHPHIAAFFSALLPCGKMPVVNLFERLCCRKSDWTADSFIGVRYMPSDTKYFVPYRIYDNGTVRKAKFCDTEFRVPVEAEKFLAQFFGDWRKLPPIEQRVPKHEGDGAWFYSEMKEC